jgi:hypothetical protein
MSEASAKSIRHGLARAVVGGVLVFAGSSGLGAGLGLLGGGWRVAPELGLSAAHAAQIRAIGNVCNWNDVDWDQMTRDEQQAWETLGWSRTTWENDLSSQVYSEQQDWSQLTLDEKSAAEALGYSASSWDSDVPCPPSQ